MLRSPVLSGKKSCGVKKELTSHFSDYSFQDEEEDWESWSRSLVIGDSIDNQIYENSGDQDTSSPEFILKGVTNSDIKQAAAANNNSSKINKASLFSKDRVKKFKIDACCGTLPDWKPYSTMKGERGCCAAKVYDKQFDTCCGGRVTEIGSCGLEEDKIDIQARSGDMRGAWQGANFRI